jgi:hypothetical protein
MRGLVRSGLMIAFDNGPPLLAEHRYRSKRMRLDWTRENA